MPHNDPALIKTQADPKWLSYFIPIEQSLCMCISNTVACVYGGDDSAVNAAGCGAIGGEPRSLLQIPLRLTRGRERTLRMERGTTLSKSKSLPFFCDKELLRGISSD